MEKLKVEVVEESLSRRFNMRIDKLTLISGKPIPCPELRASIHQPKISEIALLGEKVFYEYLGIFKTTVEGALNSVDPNLPKEKIEAVKTHLSFYTDFQIVLEMQRESQESEIGLTTILMMLFPQYDNIKFEDRFILLTSSQVNSQGKPKFLPLIIDDEKWSTLCNIASTIFCLDGGTGGEDDFNPASEQARAIAEKLKKRHEILNQHKTEKEYSVIIAHLISSLSIGAQISLNEVLDYTIYQLFTQLKRYGLHEEYRNAIDSILAGAKQDEIQMVDWMREL